jgi:hypothetical protein
VYKPKNKRPCKICGTDLNRWGEDRKGACPDCLSARRETYVLCAGRCKQRYKLRLMEPVSFYFEPGKKGGKKFMLYFCLQCFVAAKGRARLTHETQSAELDKTDSRRVRKMRAQKKKRSE